MAKTECIVKLNLSENESLCLKMALQYVIKKKEFIDYGSTSIQVLSSIEKALPDWFRAYNTDEQLDI